MHSWSSTNYCCRLVPYLWYLLATARSPPDRKHKQPSTPPRSSTLAGRAEVTTTIYVCIYPLLHIHSESIIYPLSSARSNGIASLIRHHIPVATYLVRTNEHIHPFRRCYLSVEHCTQQQWHCKSPHWKNWDQSLVRICPFVS